MTSSVLQTTEIIVPVHDEPEGLAEVVAQVERCVPQPFVVHAVYDSEGDLLRSQARTLGEGRPWLRLSANDGDPGVVNAVRRTFRDIRQGPVVVTFAGAGDDLSVVPGMLALYRRGHRIVCASRFATGGRQIGGSRLKRALLGAAGLSLRILIRFPTSDLNNNFRLYDAALVDELGIESTEGAELALELTAKAFRRRVPIAEVPVVWTDRRRVTPSAGATRWLSGYLRWYGYALRSGRR
jgi:hypothetical protein